jgi:hypothetical protein
MEWIAAGLELASKEATSIEDSAPVPYGSTGLNRAFTVAGPLRRLSYAG